MSKPKATVRWGTFQFSEGEAATTGLIVRWERRDDHPVPPSLSKVLEALGAEVEALIFEGASYQVVYGVRDNVGDAERLTMGHTATSYLRAAGFRVGRPK